MEQHTGIKKQNTFSKQCKNIYDFFFVVFARDCCQFMWAGDGGRNAFSIHVK
jgi:hypothetical protein